MKLTGTITILTVALVSVQAYQTSSLFDNGSLVERQVLLRRAPTSEQPRGQSSSPPRVSAQNSRSSVQTAQDHQSTSQTTLSSVLAQDPALVPQISHESLSPAHSDGDSDSSMDHEGVQKPKVKTVVTGPATVRWKTGFSRRQPEQGLYVKHNEQFKQSVRDDKKADMHVLAHDGNPPGRAKMTVRGPKWTEALVDARAGGHGTFQGLRPDPDPQPIQIPSEKHGLWYQRPRHGSVVPKFKSTIQGPGKLHGEGID